MLAATVVRPEVISREVTSPEVTQVRFVGRISALEIVYKRELVLAVAQWLACLKELKSAGAATKSAGAATKSAGAAAIAPGSATDAAASSVHGSKYGTTAGSKHGPAAAAYKGSATANGSATAAAVAISAPRWSISLDLKAEMPMLIFPLLPSHATSPRARYDAPTSGDPAGHSAVSSGAARSGSVRRRPTSRTGAAPSTAPPPDAHDGAMEEGASGRGGGAWSRVSSTPAEPRPNTAPNTAPTPLRALVLDFGRVACYHAPPAGLVRAGGSGGGAQHGAIGRAHGHDPAADDGAHDGAMHVLASRAIYRVVHKPFVFHGAHDGARRNFTDCTLIASLIRWCTSLLSSCAPHRRPTQLCTTLCRQAPSSRWMRCVMGGCALPRRSHN